MFSISPQDLSRYNAANLRDDWSDLQAAIAPKKSRFPLKVTGFSDQSSGQRFPELTAAGTLDGQYLHYINWFLH